MNAVKALLIAKEITFNERHGVSSHNMRRATSKISITNEGVKIQNNGVLPSLSNYFGETEISSTHSLQDLLFNLPYIHRTYCLTYPSQKDMFIPIRECQYVTDRTERKAFFQAKLSADFSNKNILNRLPAIFKMEINENDYIIKSVHATPFLNPGRPTKSDVDKLTSLHKKLRQDLYYINGVQTLWYIKAKANPLGPARLSRFSLTITLAAMHRLSELCRYKPLEFSSFLSGQKNWLLSEFIQQAPVQFFDEISSEITGHQFLVPNVRLAS